MALKKERCSTSLILRETQIKTGIRRHTEVSAGLGLKPRLHRGGCSARTGPFPARRASTAPAQKHSPASPLLLKLPLQPRLPGGAHRNLLSCASRPEPTGPEPPGLGRLSASLWTFRCCLDTPTHPLPEYP